MGLRVADCGLPRAFAFPDHHRYTARDMDRLVSAARTAGAAAFVTTEKDRVRLGELAAGFSELIPLKTAGLRIEIEDEGPTVDSLADQVRLMQRPHRGS
jgi:tetraacyldisaccharide-1-P 4'-kinase